MLKKYWYQIIAGVLLVTNIILGLGQNFIPFEVVVSLTYFGVCLSNVFLAKIYILLSLIAFSTELYKSGFTIDLENLYNYATPPFHIYILFATTIFYFFKYLYESFKVHRWLLLYFLLIATSVVLLCKNDLPILLGLTVFLSTIFYWFYTRIMIIQNFTNAWAKILLLSMMLIPLEFGLGIDKAAKFDGKIIISLLTFFFILVIYNKLLSNLPDKVSFYKKYYLDKILALFLITLSYLILGYQLSPLFLDTYSIWNEILGYKLIMLNFIGFNLFFALFLGASFYVFTHQQFKDKVLNALKTSFIKSKAFLSKT